MDLCHRSDYEKLRNPLYYLANATGFALGIFTGMYAEEKLSIGINIIQIVTSRESDAMIESLKSAQYSITTIDARGGLGPVWVILSITKREDIPLF